MRYRTVIMTGAMIEERPEIQNVVNVLFEKFNIMVKFWCTGIGKINSLSCISRVRDDVMSNNWNDCIIPSLVLNVGTCGGSSETKVGDILVCDNFIDIDMTEIQRRGYKVTTPIAFNYVAFGYNGVTCGTSDVFSTSEYDYTGLKAYDMEAYPQAMVCKECNIPFVSVKCVTDIVGNNTIDDYRMNREDAVRRLGEFITPEFILSHMKI